VAHASNARSSCAGGKPQHEGAVIKPRDGDREERRVDVADSQSVGRRARRARGSDSSGEGEREQALQAVAVTNSIGGRTRAGGQDGAEAVNDGKTVSDADDRINSPGRTSGDERHMENGNGAAHGLRRDWCPEPDVGRVAHGIPARVDRLRGLGNAIVPQIALEIFRAIAETDIALG